VTDVPSSQITRWRAVVRVLRSPVDSLSCALFPRPVPCAAHFCRGFSFVPICDVAGQNSPPGDAHVSALRRRARRPAWNRNLRAVSRLPHGASAVCRAVFYGVYQGRMREAIHALKYDRLHPASTGWAVCSPQPSHNLRRSSGGDAGDSAVPLHLRSTRSADSTNRARSPRKRLKFLRKSHPQWRLTLASSTLLRQRATESQAGLTRASAG